MHVITEHAEEQTSFRDRLHFEIPDTFETEPHEDPKETIRREILLEMQRELDKDTDVNLPTQRDDIFPLEPLAEIKTPRTARRAYKAPDNDSCPKQSSRTTH